MHCGYELNKRHLSKQKKDAERQTFCTVHLLHDHIKAYTFKSSFRQRRNLKSGNLHCLWHTQAASFKPSDLCLQQNQTSKELEARVNKRISCLWSKTKSFRIYIKFFGSCVYAEFPACLSWPFGDGRPAGLSRCKRKHVCVIILYWKSSNIPCVVKVLLKETKRCF